MITDKYNQFLKEMSDYRNTINKYSLSDIRKKLNKVKEKLEKVEYITPSGYKEIRNISSDNEEQERIELRFELLLNSKRISGLLKKRGVSFDIGWNMINKIFLNPNQSLNDSCYQLEEIKEVGVSFMDTLSIDGLKAYGNYLTDLYNNTIFEGMKIIPSAQEARELAFIEFPENAKIMAPLYLPNNWETVNKYINQYKILSEIEMIMNNVDDKYNEEVK